MTTSLALSIINLILFVICFFFCRWYIRKKTSATTMLEEYRTEVYRLIAEIDSATDRDSRLVEERIKTLKELIEDTDRRIAVYIKELQRSRNAEAVYTSLGRGIRAALDSSSALSDVNVPVEISVLKSKKEKKQKNNTKAESPGRETETKEKPNIKVQIAELSARGLNSIEIAAKLNLSLAEVDLALNLLHRH